METKEVIVVTIQYRLGVFGFLAANHVNCKGNFGLKDQHFALHWVYQNIRAFGGDPQLVTLMGQSAGAASVQHQMMSSRSDGLFRRAIMMSGSALAFWAIDRQPEVLFRKYAASARIPDSQKERPDEIVRQLRRKTAEELLEYQERMPLLHPILVLFRPVVEGNWGGAFISEDPECVWKSGRYEKRQILTGVTGYEQGAFADLFYNETVRGYLQRNFDSSMSTALEYPLEALAPIKDFYFGGEVTARNIVNVLRMRDRLFDFPMYQTVEYFTRYSNPKINPLSVYRFNYTSTISTSTATNPFPINGRGASHADDLLYLFRTRLFDAAFTDNSPENEMKNYFVRFIVDYVKKGTSPLNHVGPCRRQDKANRFCEYLDIQRDSSVSPNRIQVAATNEFDLKMVQLHKYVDQMISRNVCK